MFWGGKKTFASFHDNHDSDVGTAIWRNATFESQSDLVALDPDVFFVPSYVGPSGWVGIEVNGKVRLGTFRKRAGAGLPSRRTQVGATVTRRVFGKRPPLGGSGVALLGSRLRCEWTRTSNPARR
jgi:hypothetical protein